MSKMLSHSCIHNSNQLDCTMLPHSSCIVINLIFSSVLASNPMQCFFSFTEQLLGRTWLKCKAWAYSGEPRPSMVVIRVPCSAKYEEGHHMAWISILPSDDYTMLHVGKWSWSGCWILLIPVNAELSCMHCSSESPARTLAAPVMSES